MTTVISIILLVIGFILLIKGADYLIDGSSSLAKKFAISEIVIGLSIISFGTSAPELIINIFASINHKNEIVLGNIIGSNLQNILIILGVSALIRPLSVRKNTVWREIPFVLFAVILLGILLNDSLLFNAATSLLSRTDGIILLLFFLGFLFYIYKISKIDVEEKPDIKIYSPQKMTLLILSGLLGLFIGGKLVVDNAIKLAVLFGVSEKLIALTVVALGSSLPELVTSAMAAYRNKVDFALGNILGSNIFNILLILGISPLINPVEYIPVLNIDWSILLLASILLFVSMFAGKKHKLDRWEAALFLTTYLLYCIYLVKRG